MILDDFKPTIVGLDAVHDLLPHLMDDTSIWEDKPKLHDYYWKNGPLIPVEFSVAACHFDHSTARPIYRLHQTLPDRFAIFFDGSV